ncbi:MAG: hypothetical protein ORN54_05210 [Cyclobacteriaceae bacterium]|nr:hypothetical protein [Cyclobacteriaceae bacterium]
MTYTLNINEKTKEGKSILAMLKLLAEKSESISVLEEVEDKPLAKLIAEGRKSGLADTNRVMKKMGLV